MKIRTITTGISLESSKEDVKFKQAAEFNQKAKEYFEDKGYEIQTTRIATNSWEEYLEADLSATDVINEIRAIESFCQSIDISFLSIGYASNAENIGLIPYINKNTSIIYCSSKLGDRESGISFENVNSSAKVIKSIGEETENGYGNFRFCAWANCQPGIPFFPAAYHTGESSFSIGLECSDLVMRAFSKSRSLLEAEQNLYLIFKEELEKVSEIAQQTSDNFEVRYRGIDSSVAPSLQKNDSIAFAYEKLGLGKFGRQGTLAISAVITRVLKSLSIPTCGYCGLMLPVCEDMGLAERANEQAYNLTNLLLYSAVCGCGLDTVPLSGNLTIKTIEAILLDIATLAFKLDKPLSARLLLVPGKKAGEMTNFNSPYLVDCKILAVS